GTWAVRFNRFRGEMGRPFQGRYKALHLEPGHALAQVAHYIHLNPVRAQVVSADRVLEYRWSSLPRFMGKDRPPWLEGRTVLRESGGLPDTAGGWRRYVSYLGVLAEEDQQRREERYGRLSRGWMIGSAEFRDGLQQQLVKQMKTLERVEWAGANTGANRQIREQLWEQRLQRLAKLLAIDLKQLPPRRSAAAKVELAAAMKATTSVSNGWLAERLQMGLPASVSQYIRRFRLAGSTEAHRFRTALSRINT
ncbi:MAG TPA: hypothetical protein VHE81_09555, partial [Lacipirellulaceae bacterium]|nr:hypothetical protein [Lacipirellulaceae bacterium]